MQGLRSEPMLRSRTKNQDPKLNSSVERLKCGITLRHPVDLLSAVFDSMTHQSTASSGHRRFLSLEEAWKCLFAHTSHVKTEAKAIICSVPAKVGENEIRSYDHDSS